MKANLDLIQVGKMSKLLREEADRHYSKPGGFVGRGLCQNC